MRLTPATLVNVNGIDADPASWRYALQISGPDSTLHGTYSADRVAHIRLAPHAEAPWRGVSPLAAYPATLALAGVVERQLTGEHAVPAQRLLAIPIGYNQKDEDRRELEASIAEQLKTGDGALVTTVLPRLQGSQREMPKAWDPQRVGAEPSAASVSLREQIRIDVCAAFTVPPALILDSGGAAQALRELRALWLRQAVQPLLDGLAEQIGERIEHPDLRFTLPGLESERLEAQSRQQQRAAPATAQRAQAAAALVTAGLNPEQALEAAGL